MEKNIWKKNMAYIYYIYVEYVFLDQWNMTKIACCSLTMEDYHEKYHEQICVH